jgi:hypothetical protein
MENWISARIAWLDAAIGALDATIVLGKEEELSVRAYPNPASQVITLTFPLQQAANLHVKVYDLSGRSIKNEQVGPKAPGPQVISIDISSLASGRYVLFVLDEDDILYRFPIVKSLD